MKMSKSDPLNSASEDDNNGPEKSETSGDKNLSDFKKLQPYMYEGCVSNRPVKENWLGKKSDSQDGIIRLGCVLVVNTN